MPDSSDGGASASTPSASSKRLVRILLIIGIGIPVLIEAATLFRLIGGHMSEDEAPSSASETTEAYVVEGDELLPETPPAERITALIIEPESESWVFSMDVAVANRTAAPYELQLREVQAEGGQVFEKTASQQWAAGDSAAMEIEWALPAGSVPSSLTAEARWYIGTDSARTVTQAIQFGKIPVQWRRN